MVRFFNVAGFLVMHFAPAFFGGGALWHWWAEVEKEVPPRELYPSHPRAPHNITHFSFKVDPPENPAEQPEKNPLPPPTTPFSATVTLLLLPILLALLAPSLLIMKVLKKPTFWQFAKGSFAGDITRNLLFNLTLIVFPDTVTWQIMTAITARLMMPWRTAPANYSEMLTNLCLSLNRRRKEEKEREFSAAQKIQSLHRGAAGSTDARRKQAENLQRREEERRAAERIQRKKLWQLVKAEEKAAEAAKKAAKTAQQDLISFKEREQKKLADYEEEREHLYERCERIKSAAGEQAKLHAADCIRMEAMSRRLSEVAGSNPSEEVQQLLSNAADRMRQAKDAETFLSNLHLHGPQAAERGVTALSSSSSGATSSTATTTPGAASSSSATTSPRSAMTTASTASRTRPGAGGR